MMGFSCQPPVPALLPDPPTPPAKRPPFTSDDLPCDVVEIMRDDLAEIVNMAVRVGEGTETMQNLRARLEPFGIRRTT